MISIYKAKSVVNNRISLQKVFNQLVEMKLIYILLLFSVYFSTGEGLQKCEAPGCQTNAERYWLWPHQYPQNYYKCVQGVNGKWQPALFDCYHDLLFDYAYQKCVPDNQWRDVCAYRKCPLPNCKNTTVLMNDEDPHYFFKCEDVILKQMVPVRHSCLLGTVFSYKKQRCVDPSTWTYECGKRLNDTITTTVAPSTSTTVVTTTSQPETTPTVETTTENVSTPEPETTPSVEITTGTETTTEAETTPSEETTTEAETTQSEETTTEAETTPSEETTTEAETTAPEETTPSEETTSEAETTPSEETTTETETTTSEETTTEAETTTSEETTPSEETTAEAETTPSEETTPPEETTTEAHSTPEPETTPTVETTTEPEITTTQTPKPTTTQTPKPTTTQTPKPTTTQTPKPTTTQTPKPTTTQQPTTTSRPKPDCKKPKCSTEYDRKTLHPHKNNQKYYKCVKDDGHYKAKSKYCIGMTWFSFKHQKCVMYINWEKAC